MLGGTDQALPGGFQPSDRLGNRTYVGLVLSQFLAAFNDQAAHIVAVFYGGDMLVRFVKLPGIDEKTIISIVTGCFLSPFLLFSPLAGILADKYSKRSTLVFWKMAEVAMMGVFLVGFILPHLAGLGFASLETLSIWSAALVISAVFLMGTHSTFFVPAKYGVMPEILRPNLLSKGNGILEGTSFLANILGMAFGGLLYGQLKSIMDAPSGELALGYEWIIGVVLLGLAVVGAGASLLIQRMPPAAPHRKIEWQPWRPLARNLGLLLKSRPLSLAVLGIAFFTFMTLYLRQTLIFEGEISQAYEEAQRAANKVVESGDSREVPGEALAGPSASDVQQAEKRITLLVGLVALGVGLGSFLAGKFSGSKVELGLTPIGATFLAILAAALACVIQSTTATVICLIMIGAAAGLYIVPLYTLLQHRAPKESKGNLVATSNFINVAGGGVAILVFFFLTGAVQWGFGLNLTESDVVAQPELRDAYEEQLRMQTNIPRVLFIAASLLTVLMILLLRRQLPDFFVRTFAWLRSFGRDHLQVTGLNHVPGNGPAIVVTNGRSFDDLLRVMSSIDRYTRFVAVEMEDDGQPRRWLRHLARRAGHVVVNPQTATHDDWEKALASGIEALAAGNMVAVTALGEDSHRDARRIFDELRQHMPEPILPVYCGTRPAGGKLSSRVIIGKPLAGDTSLAEIAETIESLPHAAPAKEHHDAHA